MLLEEHVTLIDSDKLLINLRIFEASKDVLLQDLHLRVYLQAKKYLCRNYIFVCTYSHSNFVQELHLRVYFQEKKYLCRNYIFVCIYRQRNIRIRNVNFTMSIYMLLCCHIYNKTRNLTYNNNNKKKKQNSNYKKALILFWLVEAYKKNNKGN